MPSSVQQKLKRLAVSYPRHPRITAWLFIRNVVNSITALFNHRDMNERTGNHRRTPDSLHRGTVAITTEDISGRVVIGHRTKDHQFTAPMNSDEALHQVHQILRHTAEKLNYETDEQLEDLFRKTGWYFDNKMGKKAASYDIFKRVVTTPGLLDERDIDEPTREVLISNIKHRLTPQAMKIRADFEVSCFTFEGIDAVKKALHAGLVLNSEDLPIRINLIAPPLYVLTTQTMEWTDGLAQLSRVLDTIQESIESQGGTFKLKQAPRLVSDTDEADLRRHMAELEEANREVSGDEDEEEDGEDDEDGDEDEEEDGDEDEEGDNASGAVNGKGIH